MFTCVIPTLWKSPRITKLVEDLCNCEQVVEVIIINNSQTDKLTLLTHDKIKMFDMEENIYVNPAWNFGIKHAKHNDVVLINDDINFKTGVFEFVEKNKPNDYGVIGMAEQNYNIENKNLSITSMSTPKKTGTLPYGWGCLLFVNKLIYVPIPDDLLIWCGDDWLSMNMPIFQLGGLKIDTEMCTTTGQCFSDIQHKDLYTFNTKYLMQLNKKTVDKSITVIMPSFLGEYKGAASNREEKLRRAIRSFLAQGIGQLIIIADGCQKTVDIVGEFNHPSVTCHLIDKQPLFSGMLRQIGIGIATTEWVCYLDSDDEFAPGHLKTICDNLDNAVDWFYYDDILIDKHRDCMLALGRIGTSCIVHKQNTKAVWPSGYAHDWGFIQQLGPNYKKITGAGYIVKHIPGQVDQ